MLPVLLLLSRLAAFSVPDPAAWRLRLDLVGASVAIPGAKDFHEPEGSVFEASESRASGISGTLRATVRTPEVHRFAGFLGAGLGQSQMSWSCLTRPWFGDFDDIEEEARMHVVAPLVELVGGVEVHPWRRHFFALEAVLPVPLGDGDLEYSYAGETVHSGTAPSSFRPAIRPRVLTTWDYRLLDRIDLGLGVGLANPDFFAETPEVEIPEVGRLRLQHGGGGPWLEVHAGWTFGRAAAP